MLQRIRSANMPDVAAGWPQAGLYETVPWLLLALAEARSGRPASAERTKAAAMQLLPPLLDGLHARMLILLNKQRSAHVKRLLMEPFFDTLVRSATCVCRRQRVVPCVCVLCKASAIVLCGECICCNFSCLPVLLCECSIAPCSGFFGLRNGVQARASLREWSAVGTPLHVTSSTGHL